MKNQFNGRLTGTGVVAVLLGSFAVALAVEVPDGFLQLFKPTLPKRIENPENPASPEKIDLGRMLYYDTRFSKAQDISCNSCHQLDKYGADGEKTSPGHKKQLGSRNSPTVYNAAGHIAQFWDGRAATVEEQALMPVLNSVEMAMPSKEHVVTVLKSMPGYVEAFKKAYPDDKEPVTFKNFGLAIGAFERGLTTPAPWDRYLTGDKNAVSDAAKQGFMDFFTLGCIACHMGTHLGANMYQKIGVARPWPNQKDQGRYEITKQETDRMFFKVPTLRNVAKTAPYFHDGSVATLEEAIKVMNRHQIGSELPDAKVKSLISFLETLTGEIPMDYIKQPQLPPSGPDTPKPDLN